MKPKKALSNINPEPFPLKTNELEVYLPHHITVTIRERNADDEQILSSLDDFRAGKSIPKFLSAIITGPEKFTYEDIQGWPSRSKYYLMYRERMAYFGSLVEWDQKFRDADGRQFSVAYEEDIARFDRDLQNPDISDYAEGQILAYPNPYTGRMEYTTTSGNKYRMDYLTGFGELEAATLSEAQLNINTRFVIRNLEAMDNNGNWHKIQNFRNISSKDTSELRKHLDENDRDFDLVVPIKNPKTGEYADISLFGVNNFLFQ